MIPAHLGMVKKNLGMIPKHFGIVPEHFGMIPEYLGMICLRLVFSPIYALIWTVKTLNISKSVLTI